VAPATNWFRLDQMILSFLFLATLRSWRALFFGFGSTLNQNFLARKKVELLWTLSLRRPYRPCGASS